MAGRSVEEDLTRLLAAWALGSVAAGALLRRRAPGFARQTALWGVVDGAIAGVGAVNRERRGPTPPARLRRVLLINAALDVGYVGTGAAVALSEAGRRRGWRGHGAAVVVQGAFLLALDSWFARRLRRAA